MLYNSPIHSRVVVTIPLTSVMVRVKLHTSKQQNKGIQMYFTEGFIAKGFKGFKELFTTVGKGFAVAWAKEYGITPAQIEVWSHIITKGGTKNV